jgi:hypothetical protein
MFDKKNMLLCILYTVLAFVFVSLDGTYQLTYKLFGKMTGKSQADYGTGNKLPQPGFIIHILVFALLIALPMFLNK